MSILTVPAAPPLPRTPPPPFHQEHAHHLHIIVPHAQDTARRLPHGSIGFGQ